MSLPRIIRVVGLAVLGALAVAVASPAFAQKSYQCYSVTESFGTNVAGLGAINANGTFLAFDSQGQWVLIGRGGARQLLGIPPGVANAYYTGLNASGAAAGTGFLADYSDSVAFVREANGNFRVLSFPPGAYPQTTGINDGGDVVGTYVDAAGNLVAFVANANAQIRPINVPGAFLIFPSAINAFGVVVGTYYDELFDVHNFIMDGKGVRDLTVPGAAFAYVTCINNNGTIGGEYFDGTKDHGFLWKGGKLTTIDYQNPEAPASFTREIEGKTVVFTREGSSLTVGSVNDRGDVVGYTSDIYTPDDPEVFAELIQKSFWGTPH